MSFFLELDESTEKITVRVPSRMVHVIVNALKPGGGTLAHYEGDDTYQVVASLRVLEDEINRGTAGCPILALSFLISLILAVFVPSAFLSGVGWGTLVPLSAVLGRNLNLLMMQRNLCARMRELDK